MKKAIKLGVKKSLLERISKKKNPEELIGKIGIMFIKKKNTLEQHISTRERYRYYPLIYREIFDGLRKATVIDLGAGINGLSYEYIPIKTRYIAIEAVKQLVDETNKYFREKNIDGIAMHEDLFELEKIIEIIKSTEKPRVVLLMKVIDALESIEKNYSKKLLLKLREVSDRIVISIPTESIKKRESFRAKRTWLKRFLEENFTIKKTFNIPGEEFMIVEP